MTSQITSLTIAYSTVYSGTDQRKYQSFASVASVRGIQRWPMNSPHKGPVTRKLFPFDDVIMDNRRLCWHAWKGSDLQSTDCCYKSTMWYAQKTQRHTRHLKLTWMPRSLFRPLSTIQLSKFAQNVPVSLLFVFQYIEREDRIIEQHIIGNQDFLRFFLKSFRWMLYIAAAPTYLEDTGNYD